MSCRIHHLVLVLLLFAACQAPADQDPDSRLDSADALYEAHEIWHIDLDLSRSSIDALAQEPRVFVPGRLRVGDEVFDKVGVRLKGAFSFQTLGGKAAFKVKLNHYVDDQRLFGLETLTLNNLRQDRSMMHEWLSYRIFALAEVPAPRSGFAWVTVNGAPYGLYANVETPDDRLMKRLSMEGNLYEAPWGADLSEEGIEKYEQDEGEDTSRQDLSTLIDLMAETDADALFFGEDAPFDTAEFLRFMAAEALVSHWDGYWKSNNYFLFHDIENEKWSFHPWGLDQSLDGELQPFSSQGVLAELCLATPSCLAAYARAGRLLTARLLSSGLADEMRQMAPKLDAFIERDPRSPHSLLKNLRFQSISRELVLERPKRLLDTFQCADESGPLDRDGDGREGCFSDCDDQDAEVYPGAIEVCDGKDNNCDGRWDESDCPCIDLGEGRHLCTARLNWQQANEQCEARGQVLASPQDADENIALARAAEEHVPGLSVWLGANDRNEEGDWETPLGLDVDLHFMAGEPDDFGDEDCAILANYADGAWADEKCQVRLPFLCENLP